MGSSLRLAAIGNGEIGCGQFGYGWPLASTAAG
jgi:hypothetical protein